MVSFSFLNALDAATIVFIVLLVLLIVALLVVPMFTNKKRAKQTEELHRSLQPGDLVKTVGGIIGTIKEIRQVSPVDKEMVIETGEGDNKTTMVFDIQALYQVMSRSAVSTVAQKEENSAEPENKEPESAPVVAPVVEEPAAEPVEEAKETVAEEAAVSDDVANETSETAAVAPEAENAAEQKAPVAQKSTAKKPAQKKPVNSAKKTTSGTAKNTKK